MEPGEQPGRWNTAARLAPALGRAAEERAEHLLGVGRADRLEAARAIQLVLQASRRCDHPLAPAPGALERLRVRLRQRAPHGGADVHEEDRRLQAFPCRHERAADWSR